MLFPADNGKRFNLKSPTLMPRAGGFLWNKNMLIQTTCRGYATAQFMQPEPAKYSYLASPEAKNFMLPEHPYFAHYPGRFVYLKDEETGEIFSAPHEPVRAEYEDFTFSQGQSDISWQVRFSGIEITMQLSLPKEDTLELWKISVKNFSGRPRKLSVYPYFTIGYMSWMSQSAEYNPSLKAIVATAITPYQQSSDYPKQKYFKDKTYLVHERQPDAYETQQTAFEGEGGLHNPSAIQAEHLSNSDARYETPTAVLQYRIALDDAASEDYRFIFGPAFDENEIAALTKKHLSQEGFAKNADEYANYVAEGKGVLSIETPDAELNNFVNHWISRQVFYHGDVNRLSTDPQTRNFLQDHMGMSYIKPEGTRAAFLFALAQQEASGAMPDGILMHKDAELKFINQIPHTDHCVWLPVCLQAYLDETGDLGILQEPVAGEDGKTLTVYERISAAMQWLLEARDERGLSYIAQGDWCDPMNMVGYKGIGVSGWLSVATAYALNLWSAVCETQKRPEDARKFTQGAKDINTAVNKYLWDGDWYGRGITDDNVVFGVSDDKEGRIFLNPQSWAILADTCNDEQRQRIISAVDEQLETPYGVMMLAPSYTAMREDVGRVTQKHPGAAENGSVYNHAGIFYIFSLYKAGEADRAYRLLRQMIPGADLADYEQRGQLPVFIPNYYRGAYYQFPRTAGRSSQLFNTGTIGWVYRTLVEGLFGIAGEPEGLRINPQLPDSWPEAKVVRIFRGATFNIAMKKTPQLEGIQVTVDGEIIEGSLITEFTAGKSYDVAVALGVTYEQ